MTNQPKLVSRVMMNTLLGDQAFLRDMPEFAKVAQSLNLLNAPSRTGGCSSCKKRRIEHSAFNEFLTTLRGLPQDKLASVKKKLDAASLTYNMQDPRTGRYEIGRL
jgi:hypothetical protein